MKQGSETSERVPTSVDVPISEGHRPIMITSTTDGIGAPTVVAGVDTHSETHHVAVLPARSISMHRP